MPGQTKSAPGHCDVPADKDSPAPAIAASRVRYLAGCLSPKARRLPLWFHRAPGNYSPILSAPLCRARPLPLHDEGKSGTWCSHASIGKHPRLRCIRFLSGEANRQPPTPSVQGQFRVPHRLDALALTSCGQWRAARPHDHLAVFRAPFEIAPSPPSVLQSFPTPRRLKSKSSPVLTHHQELSEAVRPSLPFQPLARNGRFHFDCRDLHLNVPVKQKHPDCLARIAALFLTRQSPRGTHAL